MLGFALRRVLTLVPILFGVTLLVFAVIAVTPGDPVRLALGAQATPQAVAGLRAERGLDDPLYVQYGRYVGDALHGDLGRSFRGNVPVAADLARRLPNTLKLAGVALGIATVLGPGIGAAAATTRRRWLDTVLSVGSLGALSLPVYWLAVVSVLLFSTNLGWVSATGSGQGVLLPALVLTIGPTAVLAQLTRASMLEVAHEDHVRTARSKGLPPAVVALRHVLRNALIPVITVLGLITSELLTGAVFVEVVFARSGLGSFAVTAVHNRDLPQIQGVVLFAALVFVLVNLVTDLLYGVADPRVRTGAGSTA